MGPVKYSSSPSSEVGAGGDVGPSWSNSRLATGVTRVASGRRQTEKTEGDSGEGTRELAKCSGVKDIQSLKAVLRRQSSGEAQEKGIGRKGGEQLANNKEFTGGTKRRRHRRRDVDLRAQIFKLLDKHIYEKSQTLRSQFILSDNVFSSNPGPVRIGGLPRLRRALLR